MSLPDYRCVRCLENKLKVEFELERTSGLVTTDKKVYANSAPVAEFMVSGTSICFNCYRFLLQNNKQFWPLGTI